MAQGEYGARAGLPRILRMLDRFNIPAAFFVPAISAKIHRQSMKDILSKRRHGIGVRLDSRTQFAAGRGRRTRVDAPRHRALTEITGKKPVGMRTPSWDFSPATMKLAREFGLMYDSSLMADDRPYEVLIDGSATGVVELPVEWIMDDFPYFGMDRQTSLRPLIPRPTKYSPSGARNSIRLMRKARCLSLRCILM